LGNVTESMLVESCQNIRIKGLVSCAKVQATRSILVEGNILTSVITAGKALDCQKKVLPQLHILADGLQEMVIVIRRLLNRNDFKNEDTKVVIGPVVKLLLEGKYCYLIDAAKVLSTQIETVSQGMPAEGMGEFIRNVKKVLVNFSLTVKDLSGDRKTGSAGQGMGADFCVSSFH